MMKLTKENKKVTLENDGVKWLIATSATGIGSAGPGYVYKLNVDGKVILDDSDTGPGWINDGVHGGLGTFGWQHARKFGNETIFKCDGNWGLENNAWPLDGRQFEVAGVDTSEFGVRECNIDRMEVKDGKGYVYLTVTMGDPWDSSVVQAKYEWIFSGRQGKLTFRANFLEPYGPTPFIKEPKIVFHAKPCSNVKSEFCQWKGELPDTGQCKPKQQTFSFVDTPLKIEVQEFFGSWAGYANDREKFGPEDGPCEAQWDCHGGKPQQKFELIRKNDASGATLLIPAWEGGRGPYDCEPLSRKLIAEQRRATLVCKV